MADSDRKPVRLYVSVIPRTISTAFTKCLSAIEGMEVWFECFTYCSHTAREYKLATGEDMPMEYEGNEKQVQQAVTVYERLAGCKLEADRLVYGNVKRKLEESTSRYILAKEVYWGFPDQKSREYMPAGFKHVFLIRDPYKVFSSFKKAEVDQLIKAGLWTDDAETFDLEKDDPFVKASEFFRSTHELWKYIRTNVDPDPIVINTDDLLANPAEVLSKFCHRTGLPYSDSLLQWDASPDVTKTWKVTIDNVLKNFDTFYETATCSSEFIPPKPPVPKDRLAPDVRRLAEASMPYFQEMNMFKI
ncbi:uncharacterized protein LOC105446718 [Strongylocentrotus purpuratus]|uniref:Uncharacterized protein n=1 Tax=Strongylocentrotus purpuratus TaxID=7668 RepID=A0A7M7LWM9_STRPU|nr:uncharacterized protein LOC105446718 [Strongylocentrotus purpuratus]|eukprot:XP_011682193.1 PREDICTED: uncharacterized protein LOC105446718 [Strongylocentrotus purpuratus]